MSKQDPFNQSKISPEFATRLDGLEPKDKICVIVLLQIKDTNQLPAQRQSRAARQAAIQAIRESAKEALININEILTQFDGHLLAEYPNILGAIPLEITVAGVNALVEADVVKAVIEDQTILPRHSCTNWTIT